MVLTKVALYANQRAELPDIRSIEAAGNRDWQSFLQGFFSTKSYVLAGFEVTNYSTAFSGLSLALKQSDISLFHAEATTQANGFYVSAGSEVDATVTLQDGVTNYVELDLAVSTGANDQRTFLDPVTKTEYQANVDTVIYLNVSVTSNSIGFTTGRIPLYKVVCSGGHISTIQDCRNLFFSLVSGGTSPSLTNTFSWPSLPNSTYQRTNTPTTSTSSSDPQCFQGGDKNITSWKQWMDAVMSQVLEIKGTASWTQAAPGSLSGLFGKIAGVVTPVSSGAEWSWSGTALSITDTNGSPASTDVVADIRIMGNGSVLQLKRADGQASTSTITIANDSVLFVQIPTAGTNRDYSGSGSASTNYQVVARSSFVQSDQNFWLAYNENGNLVLRNGLKLATGQTIAIGNASATAPFVTNTVNPATTGVLRAANNEAVFAARNAANGANFSWLLNASNQWSTTAPIVAPNFISSTANPASTGVVRYANAEGPAWRNAANSADLTLTVDSSNRLSYSGAAGILSPTFLASSTTLYDTTATGSLKFGSISTSNDAGSTTWQANKNVLSDTNGGASIVAYGNDGTQTNAGSIEFTAYGTGAGSTANMFRFFNRTGAGVVTEQFRITSNAVKIGGLTLTNSSNNLVTSGGISPQSSSSALLTNSSSNRTLSVTTNGTSTAYPIVVSAAPSTHGLMIVRGRISDTGTLLSGEGIASITHSSTGLYTVTFTTTFADVPSITATSLNDTFISLNGDATASQVTFQVRTGGNVLVDSIFHFSASGQRGA
jgi:hypothetical protein